MTTCRKIFTFSWPLRGRGGSTQAVSLTAFFPFFFVDAFPNKIEKLCQADFKKINWQHLSAFVGVHKVVQANDKSECEQVNKIGTLLILWAGADWWRILSGSSWGNPEVYGQELESRTFVAATQFCDIWWWYWATMAFLFSEPCRCVLSLKRINPPLGVWLWLGPYERCPVQRFEKLVCHVTIIDFDRGLSRNSVGKSEI